MRDTLDPSGDTSEPAKVESNRVSMTACSVPNTLASLIDSTEAGILLCGNGPMSPDFVTHILALLINSTEAGNLLHMNFLQELGRQGSDSRIEPD